MAQIFTEQEIQIAKCLAIIDSLKATTIATNEAIVEFFGRINKDFRQEYEQFFQIKLTQQIGVDPTTNIAVGEVNITVYGRDGKAMRRELLEQGNVQDNS